MTLVRVDFPLPFSPRRACTSPDMTSNETSSSARTPGKLLEIPVTLIKRGPFSATPPSFAGRIGPVVGAALGHTPESGFSCLLVRIVRLKCLRIVIGDPRRQDQIAGGVLLGVVLGRHICLD